MTSTRRELIASLVVVLGLGACSSGSSPGARARAPGGGGLLAYSECMRSHGVRGFPDPNGSGEIPKPAVVSALQGVTNAQAEAAQTECGSLLPAGGSLSGQPSQKITAQQEQYYLSAATCMRSHGINGFPDPTFSGGSVAFEIPSSVDTTSAGFTQAEEACRKLIPAGLPYSQPPG